MTSPCDRWYFAILLILLLPAVIAAQDALDLADLDGGVVLDGGWELYWERFLDPGAGGPESGGEILSGGFWNADGYPVNGYGSLVRRISLDPEVIASGQVLGLQVRDVLFAYRLYVNGELVLENGTPGTDRESERGSFRMRTAYFRPESTELEILFHISNFHDVDGGFRHVPMLGTAGRAGADTDALRMLDLFIFGALTIMALYHFGLYYLRRKERSPLYFGVFTLSLAIRGGLTGARFFHDAFPGIPLTFMIDVEVITVYLAAFSLNAFIVALFPRHEIRWFTRLINILVPVYVLLALVLGIPALLPFHIVFEILLLIEGGILIYYLIRGVKDRTQGAGVMLAGVIIIVLTVINDVVYDLAGSGGLFLSSYGLFLFTFLQAFLISRNFTRAFKLSEQFSAEMQLMANSFSRFVPREFLNMLNKESILHIRLGDQVELDMAVMFCDIRQFTSLSEQMKPGENFNFINSYLSRISPVIREHGGFIDKYIGDGIMALFPGSPRDALDAAYALLQTLDEYNLGRINAGYQEIKVGIGINYGRLMLGTIGEEHRLEGTVISDTVNLASRLEQLTKLFSTDVIISERLADCLGEDDASAIRRLGRIRVKGKSEPVSIYEVLDPGDPAGGELKAEFEAALDAYLSGGFDSAREALTAYLARSPEDQAAVFYLKRLEDAGDPAVITPAEEFSEDVE
jgi:adenylate cyclase